MRKLVPYSARRKRNRKRPASTLEKAIYAILKSEKIAFTKEKAIGRCHVDVFIEPRTVIELQGCYWHACPCQKPKAGWTEESLAVQAKDSERHAWLRSEGYRVVLIWECELAADPERVRGLLFRLRP